MAAAETKIVEPLKDGAVKVAVVDRPTDIETVNQSTQAIEILRREENRVRDLLVDGGREENTKRRLEYAKELELILCAMVAIERQRRKALETLAGDCPKEQPKDHSAELEDLRQKLATLKDEVETKCTQKKEGSS